MVLLLSLWQETHLLQLSRYCSSPCGLWSSHIRNLKKVSFLELSRGTLRPAFLKINVGALSMMKQNRSDCCLYSANPGWVSIAAMRVLSR